MKILLIVLLVFSLITPVATASEIVDYLDELVYIELQISAVTTDMYMYLKD